MQRVFNHSMHRVVMVHDYGCYGFLGVRKAVDEFCGAIGQLPIELSVHWSAAVLRKPLPAPQRNSE